MTPTRMQRPTNRSSMSGFTMIELMITVIVLGLIMIGVTIAMLGASNSKTSTSNRVEAAQAARAAVDLMVTDLRSAGYGADLSFPGTPQPAIAYVDSLEIILSGNLNPYPDTSSVVTGAPQAYDPAANPKPFPLAGTAWQPPAKYTTGAELIRYTLDSNNDGAVTAADQSSAVGSDAQATPNPDDYVLVRQVYGDSTANVAGDNGGTTERIALVRAPGAGIPAMFNVYMQGSSTPYDWSNGPVPAGQLDQIARVEVNVTAASSRRDARGRYADTQVSGQVNSLRNRPNLSGIQTHPVTGYVFSDLNRNGVRDTGEPGLSAVAVRAGGTYVGYTGASGFFTLNVPAGSWTIRHTPPAGYGVFTSPDSFRVTVPPAASVSFADTARAGGWIDVHVWDDINANGSQDTGELPLENIAVRVTPGGQQEVSSATGDARLFATPGTWTVQATVPDSMAATTPNPVTGSMVDGGSASVRFGLQRSLNGTIIGSVFRDANRSGTKDTGEPGIQNVWVGVTKNGTTIAGYAYTDGNGDYRITVPANDPPRTQQYLVYVVPPGGYFPTTSTAYANQWVQSGATVGPLNFGVLAYQIITLSASRILSLASADLIEKDWNGNQTQNARMDTDLILGADAGGTDNISVWFNQYNSSTLFTSTPTYTRNAPQSVMAMAVDQLDTSDPIVRPDVVTGTRITPSGNFFVWLNQNTSGNLGYLPTTFSPALNYRTLDGGDVQAVATLDCSGGPMPDIIVGTKSPTAGRGTIEVWESDDGASPTYRRDETYPSAGQIPGNIMGEVTAMQLADMDNDGDKDIVVGTSTGAYSGELLVFENISKVNGSRFRCRSVTTLYTDAVTSLAVTDVNRDGYADILVGTQTSTNGGNILQYNSNPFSMWSFTNVRNHRALGIVMSLSATDLGGGPGRDIAVGWRANTSSFGGGVEIYFLDLGVLPGGGTDPSAGAVVNMVPAMTNGNFNYGVQPALPTPPYLNDLAVGVKTSLTGGALVVFIR